MRWSFLPSAVVVGDLDGGDGASMSFDSLVNARNCQGGWSARMSCWKDGCALEYVKGSLRMDEGDVKSSYGLLQLEPYGEGAAGGVH